MCQLATHRTWNSSLQGKCWPLGLTKNACRSLGRVRSLCMLARALASTQ